MLRVLAMLILISSVALAGQENVIKGIEPLQWGKGQDCTYIGALTALAHYVGDKDVTYDFLMGTSGQAFRVQKFAKGWCPSAADSGCGFNCCETAPKALAYDLKWLGWHDGKSEAEKSEAMGKPMMESIDKGNPALVLDLDYALEMANKDQYYDYFSGFKAYDEWIGALVDEPAFKKMSPEELKGAAHANAFCYASLIDARSAAARYLKSVKNDLGPGAAPHLLAAAEIYDRIVEKLKQGEVVYYWELDKKKWTPEMRRKEAVLLKCAASMEKQAIEELRQARRAAK